MRRVQGYWRTLDNMGYNRSNYTVSRGPLSGDGGNGAIVESEMLKMEIYYGNRKLSMSRQKTIQFPLHRPDNVHHSIQDVRLKLLIVASLVCLNNLSKGIQLTLSLPTRIGCLISTLTLALIFLSVGHVRMLFLRCSS